MNATMPQHALSVPTPSATEDRGAASDAPRSLLRLEGAVAGVGATLAYAAMNGRWSLFALLLLVPDLSMLGYLAGRRVGAACYNAIHSYLGAALLAALGLLLGAHALSCVACIWAAHIGFDRLLGYGLKYGTSFGDSHLGHMGRSEP